MLITLFDFEGNSLGYTDKILSAHQELLFSGIGSMEFHIDKTDPICSVMLENKYLITELDGNAQAIIVGVQIQEDFAIHCRSLNWLLSKIILPPLSISGTLSEIITEFIASSYGGDIILGNLPDISEELTFSSSSATELSNALQDFLSDKHLGYALRFSHTDQCFYLDILQGENLNFFISESDETLESLTLNSDILDMANSICYLCDLPALGTWNPYTNKPALSQSKPENMGKCYRIDTGNEGCLKFGLSWYSGDYAYSDTPDGTWKKSSGPPGDFYIYQEDSSAEPKYCWFYLAGHRNSDDAMTELAKKTQNSSFTAVAKNITYNKDYRLGDFVRLQYLQGDTTKTIPCQFASVTISKDNMETHENPTLKEVKQCI